MPKLAPWVLVPPMMRSLLLSVACRPLFSWSGSCDHLGEFSVTVLECKKRRMYRRMRDRVERREKWPHVLLVNAVTVYACERQVPHANLFRGGSARDRHRQLSDGRADQAVCCALEMYFFRTMTSLLDEHPAATHSMWGSFCVRQACSCGGSALRGGGLRRHVLLWYDFSSGCA